MSEAMHYGESFYSLSSHQRFLQMFYDDYLFEAYELYRAPETDREILDQLPETQLLLQDMPFTERCLELLDEMSSWHKVREEAGISTFSHGQGDNFMIGVTAMLPQPVFPVLALCAEVDLLPTLYFPLSVHRLTASEILSSPTTFRRLIRYVYSVPWPVSAREAILQCAGFPLADSHAALLTVRSPSESTFLGFPIPPADGKVVRCDMPVGCAKVTPISPDLTQMTVAGHADIKFVLFT